MFRCTVVPPPPELSGPISGHGQSRIENLKTLILKENEQLRAVRKDATTLANLIKYHQGLVGGEGGEGSEPEEGEGEGDEEY